MKQNKSVIFAIVEAVIAVFILLAVKVIAPVCTGMVETAAGKQVFMKCHYTGVVLTLLAILLLVTAIVCFVTKQELACGIMTAAISVIVFVVLNDSMGIGVCANTEMACNMMVPFVKVGATAELIVGIASAYFGVKGKNNE